MPVKDIKEIKEIAEEIESLCHQPLGKHPSALAIAHCQVDHDNPLRFFVFANGDVVINPKILKRSGKFTHKEGCMSYPFRGTTKVERYNEIEVEYTTLDGKKVKEYREGLNACVFQHEIDHFNGKSIYS